MIETQSLRHLVDLTMVRHQTSARQPGFRAQHHGFEKYGPALEQIRNGTNKSAPRDETTRAVAWLAGAGDEVTFMAAGQLLPGAPFATELPSRVDNLPTKEQKAVFDTLRILVGMNKEAADSVTQMSQTGEHPAAESASFCYNPIVHFRPKVNNASGKATRVLYMVPRAFPNADSAGEIPLPANYYELTSYSSRNYGAEEAAHPSARSGEAQDTKERDSDG